jgi:hypothetical protein
LLQIIVPPPIARAHPHFRALSAPASCLIAAVLKKIGLPDGRAFPAIYGWKCPPLFMLHSTQRTPLHAAFSAIRRARLVL